MDSLFSFPVGLFHPLQHAGLSRRTPDCRQSARNPNLRLPGTSYLENFRPTERLQDADELAKWRIALVTGKYYLPDARNETLRPCRVQSVFIAKLPGHHSLLRVDAKR